MHRKCLRTKLMIHSCGNCIGYDNCSNASVLLPAGHPDKICDRWNELNSFIEEKNQNLIFSLTDVKDEREFASYIKSINDTCHCSIMIDIPSDHNKIYDLIKQYSMHKNSIPLYMYPIHPELWDCKRMYCKFKNAFINTSKPNIKTVFVLDTDVIVQDDIFKLTDDLVIDLLDVLIESVEHFISLDTKTIMEEIMKFP